MEEKCLKLGLAGALLLSASTLHSKLHFPPAIFGGVESSSLVCMISNAG
jgi:hypothetical protein